MSSLASGFIFASNDFRIGVYYYPGWRLGSDSPSNSSGFGWAKIKDYPEREPLLGWYREGQQSVMDKQLQWMHEYGIDYVVFDWYWTQENKVRNDHALAAYFNSPDRHQVQFSLLWANHDQVPKSKQQFLRMVKFWLRYYLVRPEYLRIDDRPVVFVFSADLLKQYAEKFNSTTKNLLDAAQEIARQAGLPGIYFVAGAGARSPMADQYAPTQGYSAISAYNMHSSPSGRETEGYAELDTAYREHWTWLVRNTPLDYIVPMTSGWDMRPWGGSRNSRHDFSISSTEEFNAHLEAARVLMENNPTKTRKMGVICCWNEFGEGSFIEPTQSMGFSYLDQVQNVFGSSSQ